MRNTDQEGDLTAVFVAFSLVIFMLSSEYRSVIRPALFAASISLLVCPVSVSALLLGALSLIVAVQVPAAPPRRGWKRDSRSRFVCTLVWVLCLYCFPLSPLTARQGILLTTLPAGAALVA